MSIEVSPAIDYTPKELSAGKYIMRTVNVDGAQPTIQRTTNITTIFKLPSRDVYNLGRSALAFNFVIPAEADKFVHAHNGFLAAIESIKVVSGSNQILVEHNELPAYTKLAWRPQTPMQEFLTMPCHENDTAQVSDCKEIGHFFHRIRKQNPTNIATSVAGDAPAQLAANTPIDVTFLAGSFHMAREDGKEAVANSNDNWVAAGDDYTAVSNYLGRSLVNTPLAVRVNLPLKMIYNSLLSMDKDLYFGEEIRIMIKWNRGEKWGWTSAVCARDGTAETADLAAAPLLYNCQLRLAVQDVPSLINATIAKTEEANGLMLNIPFVHSFKGVTSGVASQKTLVSTEWGPEAGAKLLRVLAGIFAYRQQGAMYCNNYNYGSGKWTSYQPRLDNKPINEEFLAMDDQTAYMYHSEKLQGSVIKDAKDWAQTPTIVQDFSGVRFCKDYLLADSYNAGLDLKQTRKFGLEIFNSATMVLNEPNEVHLFGVAQKRMLIKNNLVTVFDGDIKQ